MKSCFFFKGFKDDSEITFFLFFEKKSNDKKDLSFYFEKNGSYFGDDFPSKYGVKEKNTLEGVRIIK